LANHYDLLIRTYLLMERNTAVQEWLDRVAALDLPGDQATLMRNRIRQAQAVLQTTPEDQAALLAARKRLVAIVEAQPPDFMLMKAQAVLALVNDALGEEEAALAALEQALVLAAPQEWIQMFVYPGERMVSLLAQIGKTTVVPEFCAAVERALRTIAPPDAETAAPGMVPGLLDPLTGRELEVLQLLAQGHTNREIANKLFIALGTTKRHIANIYSKMDVSNRTEAAVRARELGLLQV
jgi:LuxR family maltose regulon positive regulatory protein